MGGVAVPGLVSHFSLTPRDEPGVTTCPGALNSAAGLRLATGQRSVVEVEPRPNACAIGFQDIKKNYLFIIRRTRLFKKKKKKTQQCGR